MIGGAGKDRKEVASRIFPITNPARRVRYQVRRYTDLIHCMHTYTIYINVCRRYAARKEAVGKIARPLCEVSRCRVYEDAPSTALDLAANLRPPLSPASD